MKGPGSAPAPPRRRRAAPAALAALALVACAGPGGEPRSETEPARPSGTLRVALRAEPKTLNPNTWDEAAGSVGRNLYNQLVSLDTDLNPIPDLARSWEVSADGLVYTFHLADGVSWHDGRPFGSGDVAWTLRALRSEKAFAHDLAVRIAAVETPDAATVVVRLAEPWAPFLTTLAWYGTYILPRHLHAGARFGEAAADRAPVGTGPFLFTEWEPGRIVLTANRRYFRPGPHVERLVYRILGEAEAASATPLLRGEIDYLTLRPRPERLQALRREPGLVIDSRPSDARYYAGFNVRHPPFGDLRVRRAVNMALDREALVARVLAGYGAPAYGFYTPAVAWAFNERARAPAFDPAAAAALLDAAGLRPGPDGVRFSATLVCPDAAPYTDLAREMTRQLAAVGIGIAVEALAVDRYLDRLLRRRDFDLGLMGGSHGPDPANLEIRFGAHGKQQFMGYADPVLDRLLARGARQTDPAVRGRAYDQAQALLARGLPAAPLAEAVGIMAYRRGLVGLPHREARGLVAGGDFSLARWRR
jgi:peptide/nickel transport system substrate-binding protein